MNAKILDTSGVAINVQNKNEILSEEYSEIKTLIINNKKQIFLESINLFFKRIIDIIGAIVGIIVLIPLTIVVKVVNMIYKENGKIFYCQTRIGKNGKHFKMYKFRTMVKDADKKLKELLENNEELRKEWNENRKLKNDPRITKMGKFLRKTSLDEWTQLLNVLFPGLNI